MFKTVYDECGFDLTLLGCLLSVWLSGVSE